MIIVDTNQFYRLNAPSGALFVILRQVAERTSHTLAVPEMVLVETLARYRHEVEENVAAIEKGQRGLGRKGVTVDINLPDIEQMVQLRSAELRKNIDVLQPAEGSAWEALQREAFRRRPADVSWEKKGSGARDSLIWLTVLEYVRRTNAEPVLLVTADGDFGRDGQLHSELREELVTAGVDSDRIQLYPRVTSVLNQLAEKADTPKDLDEVLNSEQAVQAVAASLMALAGYHLLWQFRSRFSGPDTMMMHFPPAADLTPGSGGRTETYKIGGEAWVSAERLWTGTYWVSLDRAEAEFRQPSFEVQFEVDVTVLVAPEGHADSERIQVIDCAVPRFKLDPRSASF